MKKYIGKELVEAEPMTAEDAVKKSYKVNNQEDDGYEITYEDGYKSWIPKEKFDKTYKVADTSLDLMNIEQEELNERYNKIENFVQSKEIDEIKSEESQFLIRIQRWIMNIYLSILSNRIMNEKHNETKFHHTFEEALLGMKSGCRMKRGQ